MRFVDEQGLARHLVRSEAGEDLLASLAELSNRQRWKRALVIGAGVLELVEVRDAVGELHTLEQAELVALSGTVTAAEPAPRVVLLGTMIAGARLVTGRLVEAVAGEMLLRIDGVVMETPAAVSDLPPAMAPPTDPPPALRPTDLSVGAPAPSPPAPAREPDTIDEEVEVPAEPDTESEPGAIGPVSPAPAPPPLSAPKPPSKTFRTRPIPRRIPSRPRAGWDELMPDEGEYLDHPQLGLCRVEGHDERGGTIITVPSGRRRTLRLDALRVDPPEEDELGRRIFRILGPRRG